MRSNIFKQNGMLAAILSVVMMVSFSSHAVLITQEVTDQGMGVFEISFTIENNSTSPLDEFFVYFDDGSVDSLFEDSSFEFVVNVAPDWEDFSEQGFISAAFSIPPSFGAFTDFAPLAVGEILSGFSVAVNGVGNTGPSNSFAFEAFYSQDPNFEAFGETVTASVPAPSVFALFLGVIAASFSMRWMQGRKK